MDADYLHRASRCDFSSVCVCSTTRYSVTVWRDSIFPKQRFSACFQQTDRYGLFVLVYFLNSLISSVWKICACTWIKIDSSLTTIYFGNKHHNCFLFITILYQLDSLCQPTSSDHPELPKHLRQNTFNYTIIKMNHLC